MNEDENGVFRVDVGLALRTAMFDYGEITPANLAKKYGCSHAYISHIRKNGVASMGTIEQLAHAMEMKPSDFLLLGE